MKRSRVSLRPRKAFFPNSVLEITIVGCQLQHFLVNSLLKKIIYFD